jgi:hypothetical protein
MNWPRSLLFTHTSSSKTDALSIINFALAQR